MKDFESSSLKKIEAELLRLMRNPKCYAISTFGAQGVLRRVRLIQRQSERLWVSEYEQYNIYLHGAPNRSMRPSCFSGFDGKLAPMPAEHIAYCAAVHSKGEPTLIIGWFA